MLVEPALNSFENVLMFPSGDPSFLPVVQMGLIAQLWQTLVQSRRNTKLFSSVV